MINYSRIDFLKYKFKYDNHGELIWKNVRKISLYGTAAGYIKSNKHTKRRYILVRFMGKQWMAHQLIWLYHHGEPVPQYIDHIDGDSLNNRIENLRSCTASQNLANSKELRTNNGSGYNGVTYEKRFGKGRYIARIGYNSKNIYIGIFDDPEEVAEAYDKKALELFGEFAVLNSERIK